MNTSQQGTIGETKVMYEITKIGLPIFREISNTSKTDIITIINGKCVKIQCKCTNTDVNGTVIVTLVSRTSKLAYTPEDFDILAVYIPFLDKTVYLNWKDINNKETLAFRYIVNDNKQKNSKNIRLLETYTDFNKALEL